MSNSASGGGTNTSDNTLSGSGLALSQLSLAESSGSQQSEDWDRSLNMSDNYSDGEVERGEDDMEQRGEGRGLPTTPRNSVVFPAPEDDPQVTPGKRHSISKNGTSGRYSGGGGIRAKGRTKRSLTQLLLDQEGGSDLTSEEVSEVASVLGQWINAGSSPYEGEDDFFTRRSRDDLALPSPRLGPRDPRVRTVSAASSSSRSSLKGDTKGH